MNCQRCGKFFKDTYSLTRHLNKKKPCILIVGGDPPDPPNVVPQQQVEQDQQEYKKKSIPKALREQVWMKYNNHSLRMKCTVKWCTNIIDVFNFHVGHNIPESKGGTTTIGNLRPICARCNLSMSNNYSIDEWDRLGNPIPSDSIWKCCFGGK